MKYIMLVVSGEACIWTLDINSFHLITEKIIVEYFKKGIVDGDES